MIFLDYPGGTYTPPDPSDIGGIDANTVLMLPMDYGSGNSIVTVGVFTSADGDTANRIAAYDPATDTWSTYGTGLDGQVQSVAVNGSDVWVGGGFANAGGSPATRAAYWNGSTWSAMGSGLNSDGNRVKYRGGNVYFGGTFSSAGGVSDTAGFAYWDGTSWQSIGASLGATCYDFAWLSDNTLIAVGSFANRIRYWSGSSWDIFGGGVTSGAQVYCIAIDASDNVYIGGTFTEVNSVSANYIAKWDGSSWSALGSGLGATVRGIYLDGSDLYAMGDFTTAGGSSALGIAKWDGSSWSAMGSGLANSYKMIKYGADLYVAGGTAGITKWGGSSWDVVGGTGLNSVASDLVLSGTAAFVDISDSAHTVTANGDAQIDTAQSKFGGASGLFDGTGDYLSIPDSTDFEFSTGAFCIDAWVRPSALSGYQDIVSKAYHGTNNRGWNLQTNSGQLIFAYSDNGTNNFSLTESGTSVTTGSWQHVCIAYDGSDLHLYYNGSRVATTAYTGGVYDNAIPVMVGASENGGSNFWNGRIDEVRVSKGDDRISNPADPLYCSGTPSNGFTPPAYAYTDKR